jgi:polyhydroxyalkanoate synthesis regulator phasin
MTKPKKETQAEQSRRFEKAVQDLIDAGELSPTEAEERFEKAMNKIAHHQPSEE